MSVLSSLQKIEAEIEAYAKEAEISLEQVFAEILTDVKALIGQKRIAVANKNAATAQNFTTESYSPNPQSGGVS